MNCFKQNLSLLLAISLFFISCKKQTTSDNLHTDNQITDAVLKIETDWDGVSEKNNSDVSSPKKKESRDSDEGIAMAIRSIDKKYKEYLSNLGSNSNTALRIGNVVGVIKNDATCSDYDQIDE